MSDDINTQRLVRVVPTLIRPQTGLLSLFFPMVDVSEEAQIKFDVANGKRRISPFVSPSVAGKIVEGLGRLTNTFTPAYVKDKRVLRPGDANKRLAGEKLGGNMTMKQRRMVHLNNQLTDQVDMLTRRLEVMASEAMRTGKVTVKGEDYPEQIVDFKRNPAHTITLSAGSKWGDSGVSPMADLEDWSLTVLQNGGGAVDKVVLDTKAYRLLKQDPEFIKNIDKTLGAPDSMTLSAMAKLGLSYKGSIDNVQYWVYADWYVEPENNAETPMIPDYTVILGSDSVEGVRHFGAIEDEDALMAMEFFPKTWVENDPSLRILLMQSAPLTVLYRPNASFCATVR